MVSIIYKYCLNGVQYRSLLANKGENIMTQLTLRPPTLMGRNAFEQIFDHVFGDQRTMIKQSTSGYPITDIYKDENDNQIIEMALAGFVKEDIIIEVKENKISISYQAEPWTGDDRPARRIAKRSFNRSFVDYNNRFNLNESVAAFENGLLHITIPLKNEVKPRTIVIQ
tara:strand:- start:46 stop:552 length:507 start_codon:yes stop_codon:yes gene_type:complete